MKFIVSSASLTKQLQLISGVLNNNNTLPILDNFLFEIKEGVLHVTASDLGTTMSSQLKIDSKSTFDVAIPAKFLLDIIKSFADHPLTFSVNEENYGIEISSDYGKYKLSGFDGGDFPRVPSVEQESHLSLSSEILLKAINKTLFAAGNDDLRPIMSGVYCDITQDNITFVATDAHKLVRYSRFDVSSELSTSIILPSKPLALLKNSLSKSEDEVSIDFNQNNAFFSYGDVKLICRLLEGKYPNYEAVIPKENPNVLTVDKQLLLNSIRRVSIFANKSTYQVRFKIAGMELNISAEDLDYANEANERLTCNYQGEDMEIGFNSRFLIDMLNNVDSEEVNIEMSAPNRAGLIIPSVIDKEKEDVLMLVMPVMV